MIGIYSGKITTPVKGILYGVPGIGKSTFAAKWPKPLFIDLEQGTLQLDVDRVTPSSAAEVANIVTELIQSDAYNAYSYRTLVIDSADWMEQWMIQKICAEAGINSIEKYEKGYGKGWTKLAEDWARFLDLVDRLRLKRNMNILFIAHSKTKRYEPADDSGYDRYTLTMGDKSAEVLKKWSDLILFVKYDTFTVEENGKVKVKGSDKRVMYTGFHPCWDAKNRFGLPTKLPFEYGQIERIFTAEPAPAKTYASPAAAAAPPVTTQAPPAAPAAPPATAEPAAAPAPAPVPAEDPEKLVLLDQVKALVSGAGITEADVTAELERKGIVAKGTPLASYNRATLQRIVAGWNAVLHNINNHK